jgi:hypothetical protein
VPMCHIVSILTTEGVCGRGCRAMWAAIVVCCLASLASAQPTDGDQQQQADGRWDVVQSTLYQLDQVVDRLKEDVAELKGKMAMLTTACSPTTNSSAKGFSYSIFFV